MKKDTSSLNRNPFICILKKLEFWASLAMILGFFLPWVSNPIFSASGYHISALLEFFSISSPVSEILMVLTYLIPAGGVTIIGLLISRKPTPLTSLAMGMLPIVVLSVLYFEIPYLFRQLACGSIVTFIAGVCILLIGAFKQHTSTA